MKCTSLRVLSILQMSPMPGKENRKPPNAFRDAQQIKKGNGMHTPGRPASGITCSPGGGLFQQYRCGSSGLLPFLSSRNLALWTNGGCQRSEPSLLTRMQTFQACIRCTSSYWPFKCCVVQRRRGRIAEPSKGGIEGRPQIQRCCWCGRRARSLLVNPSSCNFLQGIFSLYASHIKQ